MEFAIRMYLMAALVWLLRNWHRLALVAAIFAAGYITAGCAGTSAEVMLGTQVRDGGFDPGHGVTATFRLRQTLTERTFCEYEHVSHVFKGPPFGSRYEEDALDQVGCGVRFGE